MTERDLPKCGYCEVNGKSVELIKSPQNQSFVECPLGVKGEHPRYMMSITYLNNSSRPKKEK